MLQTARTRPSASVSSLGQTDSTTVVSKEARHSIIRVAEFRETTGKGGGNLKKQGTRDRFKYMFACWTTTYQGRKAFQINVGQPVLTKSPLVGRSRPVFTLIKTAVTRHSIFPGGKNAFPLNFKPCLFLQFYALCKSWLQYYLIPAKV